MRFSSLRFGWLMTTLVALAGCPAILDSSEAVIVPFDVRFEFSVDVRNIPMPLPPQWDLTATQGSSLVFDGQKCLLKNNDPRRLHCLFSKIPVQFTLPGIQLAKPNCGLNCPPLVTFTVEAPAQAWNCKIRGTFDLDTENPPPGCNFATTCELSVLMEQKCEKMDDHPPILWVAASGASTVSKINVDSGIVEGRYFTYPTGLADPSRTAVSALGNNVAVVNRAAGGGPAYPPSDPARASVTLICGYESCCVDRNGNGKIDTSIIPAPGMKATLLNWPLMLANGSPTPSPDECVLWTTPLPSDCGGRAVAFDLGTPLNPTESTHVYVGCQGSGKVYRLDAKTGQILTTISGIPYPYGMVFVKDTLWVLGNPGAALTKIEVNNVVAPDRVTIYNAANGKAVPCAYGIAADSLGRIITSGGTCVSRFTPATELWEPPLVLQGASMLRGLAVDQMGKSWISDKFNGVFVVDNNLAFLKQIPFANFPPPAIMMPQPPPPSNSSTFIGAAIDHRGKPWAIDFINSRACRIDPITYLPQCVEVDALPYTYSDMSGFQMVNSGKPIVYHTFKAKCRGARWTNIGWSALAPPDTQVTLRARSAATKAALDLQPFSFLGTAPVGRSPLPVPVPTDESYSQTAPYLQVGFELRSAASRVTPILSSAAGWYTCPQ